MSQNGASILNPALSEEVDAVNAIYGTNVVASVADSNNSSKDRTDHLALQTPGQSVSFLLSFPHDYPETCPQVDGTQSTGKLGKGEGHHAAKLLQDTVEKVWTPGSVCLFDLIEEAGPLLLRLQDGASEASGQAVTTAEATVAHLAEEDEQTRTGLTRGPAEKIPSHDATTMPDWAISDPISEKKSVFIARCARVTDQGETTAFLADLLATNKKVAAATHNITAWRIRNTETGRTVQDCDDDGETAAGGRLLHLMQLIDVWGAVVVVTRWYGGVKLGPDRFRLINHAAREALVRGGFVKVDEEKGWKKRGKK